MFGPNRKRDTAGTRYTMANRETLLRLLNEYNMALERLRADTNHPDNTPTIAKQLSYLEYRILQLETQLSIIDIDVNDPSRGRFRRLPASIAVERARSEGNILTHLNPWHRSFRIWSYVTAIAILMLSVVIYNIVSAFAL